MKRLFILASLLFLVSCYGSDSTGEKVKLIIPLQISGSTDVEQSGDSKDLSIDSYFAIVKVVVKGEVSQEKELVMTISYEDAGLKKYYFEGYLDVFTGEKLYVSFGGYYNIDDTSVGGFVSKEGYQIDVSYGISSEIVLESYDLALSDVTIEASDANIGAIIFYDPVKGLFLKRVKKVAQTGSFYLRVPEGKYDIYSIDEKGNRLLIKQSQEIKGERVTINL